MAFTKEYEEMMNRMSKNHTFAAWIGNLGAYNEGSLIGEWVEFPTTEEKFEAALKRIGIGALNECGYPYEEWEVFDYDDYSHLGLAQILGSYASFDTLNEAGETLEDLSEHGYQKLKAISEIWPDDVEKILEDEDKLYNYAAWEYEDDDYRLGWELMHDRYLIPKELENWIDYEAYVDSETDNEDCGIANGLFIEKLDY